MSVKSSKYAEFGAYHRRGVSPRNLFTYNPRMLARYDLTLSILKSHDRLRGRFGLDVGCGDGVLLDKLGRAGAHASGLDVSRIALTLAATVMPEPLAAVPARVNASCYGLPFGDDSFDFVTLLDVLEHLCDPVGCLAEILRVLRPRGILVLTTPRRRPGQLVHSLHHAIEYTAPGLRLLLEPQFSHVWIYGACPAWTDDLYTARRGLKPRLFRWLCKLSAMAGFNPFMITTNTPGERWAMLVGVGYKYRRSVNDRLFA